MAACLMSRCMLPDVSSFRAWHAIRLPTRLQNSRHGFSRCLIVRAKKGSSSEALSQLRKAVQGGSVDTLHLNGAEYLKSIGFTNQAQLARVLDIAMNPKSLFITYKDSKRAVNASARPLDVEKDMKPVVEFLVSKGVSSSDVVKMITDHPPLLSYSVETRLQPFWSYLESLGITNVASVVSSRPSLLGLDVDNNLRRIVDYLQSENTPPELIAQYLAKSL